MFTSKLESRCGRFVYKELAMAEAVPAIITALAPAPCGRCLDPAWQLLQTECRRLRGELAFSRYEIIEEVSCGLAQSSDDTVLELFSRCELC